MARSHTFHCYSLVAKAKPHNLWAFLNVRPMHFFTSAGCAMDGPLTSTLLSLSLICESKQVSVITQVLRE